MKEMAASLAQTARPGGNIIYIGGKPIQENTLADLCREIGNVDQPLVQWNAHVRVLCRRLGLGSSLNLA